MGILTNLAANNVLFIDEVHPGRRQWSCSTRQWRISPSTS